MALAQVASLDALTTSGWYWDAATGGTLWIAVPAAAAITVP